MADLGTSVLQVREHVSEFLYPTAFSSWKPNDGGSEDRAWKRTYASGRLTMGSETEAFEGEFAAWLGRKHAIACNSGSSANWLAFGALCRKQEKPIQSYDAVMLPSIAWATTWSPAAQYNLHPYIADCDDTWNCPPVPLLPLDAKTVVACPVLGNPAHVADWCDPRRSEHLYSIEDCCESIGARIDGRLVGTFGDLATFSAFFSHQLSAVELGIVATDDDELARMCRLLRNHGMTRGTDPINSFEAEYDFVVAGGMNLRPLELHCAVAREQLRRLDQMIAERRRNWDYFYSVAPLGKVKPPRMLGDPSPFGFAFEVESREVRSRLAQALRTAGIDCRLPTGGSALRHPMMAPWRDQKTPIADRIHDCGMFLGLAPYPIPELIDRAVSVMRETL